MNEHRSLVLPGITLVLFAMACEDSNDGAPPCDPQLVAAEGNGQTGEVSVALPETLVVRTTTCDPANPQGPQLPEPGVPIVWIVTRGDGSLNGASVDTASTDVDGLARAVWVLGPTAGGQTVTVQAPSFPNPLVHFDATATDSTSGCPAGSVQHPFDTIYSDQYWGPGGHIVTGNIVFGATLIIAAGAHVCLGNSSITFLGGSHLEVRGTSGNPVTFTNGHLTFGTVGTRFSDIGPPPDRLGLTPSTISNARFEDSTIFAFWFHPVVVESTLVRNGNVTLDAPGSRFSHSTIIHGGFVAHALKGGPIELEATVRDSPDVGFYLNGTGFTLIRCEVTGSATDGLVSTGDAATLSITSSNFFGNGGVGVRNSNSGSLAATGNWWGDPGGPNGPNGDGVEGSVDFSGALAAPAVLGYRPPE